MDAKPSASIGHHFVQPTSDDIPAASAGLLCPPGVAPEGDRRHDEGMCAQAPAGECLFCDIVSGQAEASVVYEDTVSLAFVEIHPLGPGDMRVIPKVHAASLEDVGEPLGAHVFRRPSSRSRAAPLGASMRRRQHLPCGRRRRLPDSLHLHLHVFPARSTTASVWRLPGRIATGRCSTRTPHGSARRCAPRPHRTDGRSAGNAGRFIVDLHPARPRHSHPAAAESPARHRADRRSARVGRIRPASAGGRARTDQAGTRREQRPRPTTGDHAR
ncbi:HIT family protein [Streptomyces sp. NPDC002324]